MRWKPDPRSHARATRRGRRRVRRPGQARRRRPTWWGPRPSPPRLPSPAWCEGTPTAPPGGPSTTNDLKLLAYLTAARRSNSRHIVASTALTRQRGHTGPLTVALRID
uniref:Uncharacterized protein n=1 Tax=Zea mays TaxID=4577 RepID=A0A804U891_MAIZE